jgi:hypothetical protein
VTSVFTGSVQQIKLHHEQAFLVKNDDRGDQAIENASIIFSSCQI